MYFVDPPPIKLFHIGRKEVDDMISLLEDKWDELMVFDPLLFGEPGEVPAFTSDPSQVFEVKSLVPKSSPPKKLENIQNQESESHVLSSVYKLRAVQQYLKIDSKDPECPLTIFLVSGCLH